MSHSDSGLRSRWFIGEPIKVSGATIEWLAFWPFEFIHRLSDGEWLSLGAIRTYLGLWFPIGSAVNRSGTFSVSIRLNGLRREPFARFAAFGCGLALLLSHSGRSAASSVYDCSWGGPFGLISRPFGLRLAHCTNHSPKLSPLVGCYWRFWYAIQGVQTTYRCMNGSAEERLPLFERRFA